MRKLPILFSADMVKAILDGRKTQTRRVLRKQPLDVLPMNTQNQWVGLMQREPESKGTVFNCRYGVPGDRLWVRETFSIIDSTADDDTLTVVYATDMDKKRTPQFDIRVSPEEWNKYGGGNFDSRWRPSIHMPRWASRITLEIVSVRVERLQEILDRPNDIVAEGINRSSVAPFEFSDLWDSINAKRGYAWEQNPFVWVVEFRKM